MWVKLKLLGLDIFEAELTTKDYDKDDKSDVDDKDFSLGGELSGTVRSTGFTMVDRSEEGGTPVVGRKT